MLVEHQAVEVTMLGAVVLVALQLVLTQMFRGDQQSQLLLVVVLLVIRRIMWAIVGLILL